MATFTIGVCGVLDRIDELAEKGLISGQNRYYIIHGEWPKDE